MKKINAYAYLMVSGKGQIAGNGFDRQLKEIKRYCKGSGYKLVKVFKEQVSGTLSEKKRPEMAMMVADTGDSGSGAVFGDFKAHSIGIGPVINYILPFKGDSLLAAEFRWLPELDTEHRLKGDYFWLKIAYMF